MPVRVPARRRRQTLRRPDAPPAAQDVRPAIAMVVCDSAGSAQATVIWSQAMTPATFNPAGWTVNNNPVTTVTWVAPTMLTVTTGTTINPIDGYVFPALANGPTGVNGLTPLSAGGTVNTV